MACKAVSFVIAMLLAAIFATPAWSGSTRTIKIGVLNDMSGPYADSSGKGGVLAAKMAAEDFMAAHPSVEVEILSADHQNKPDIASGIVRRWMDVDKIDAVADVPNSAVGLAVNELLRGSHTTFIASTVATSDLTGKFCSPNTFQWTTDTWAQAHTIGEYLARKNAKKWYFIAPDYALGKALVRDTSAVVLAHGGNVLGTVYAPLNTADYSSFLLQADAADPDTIALAMAANDLVSLLKQADEMKLRKDDRTFAAIFTGDYDIRAVGLSVAKGLYITLPFYWDLNDETRAWAKRFAARDDRGRMPYSVFAGVYSSILAYLDAAVAVGSSDPVTILKKIEAQPIHDKLFGEVTVRPDGRAVHDMYIFAVKKPEASKGSWDLLEKVETIPGAVAFRSLAEGGCGLVQARQ